ncbi:hypothetical protein K7472_04405 [Streptomyces sp. PTM05]|uniref:DUF6542 domain-containing protein n=1 Tax=Streptantibioticus parmotrematis TaxID=2873249 RepID=A0ABS7QMU8_9ACTN|nr:DUF6542 domain-containing protein [Streptantibioticus parmotrematis]MBY8884086.1 hypothetical protein [Streptantibioticus parmotrematis]
MDQPRTRTPNPSGTSGAPRSATADARPRLPRPTAPRSDRTRRSPRADAPHAGRARRAPAARGAVGLGERLGRLARPDAKLTGFGAGVVIGVLTLLGGGLNVLFADQPGAFFGVVFVLASVAGALWVRRADLAAAPVSAPIAFAVALVITGDDGGGGLLAHAAATVAGLAERTGWLYTGTLLSAAVAAARHFGERPTEGAAARRARRRERP